MSDLRKPLTILALVATLALVLAACGGAASNSPDGGGGGGGDASAAPSVDAPASADASADAGGGGGGGGSVPEGFEQKLVAPNSSVTLTQSSAGTKTVIFHSTSSFDDLKSFYKSAIASLGGETFTQEVEGSYTIGWGDSGNGSGGLVFVVPSSDGGGYDVTVTTAIGS